MNGSRLMKHYFMTLSLIFTINFIAEKIYSSSKTALNQKIIISCAQAKEIGLKIWQNECNQSVKGLTSWNLNENFASMGLLHCIWYSENAIRSYEESFPKLLQFIQQHGKSLPKGILKKNSLACPWNSREEFYKNIDSPAMKKLRSFLVDTIDLQIKFIIQRFESSLPTMIKALPASKQKEIEQKFYLLAHEPNGLYALIDYINFKGLGISPHEEYQGKRWGLLQVLENMNLSATNYVEEFTKSAKKALADRVAAAPIEKHEERWLPGWYKRLNTYLEK